LIGSTVSHYRILDRLGGGGMGVVYRAVDLKLDRPVALKFLAGQRGASEESKQRFIREARAASALDHPAICTIYEIDETGDGALFIAMALCEGETLRDRIERGPLPLAEAVGIAEQMASGLARAHERGIVHRDVKPANVIVAPDGRVKIVDFGIAKLSDQSRITRAGAAVGTAGYMSPEQFHGELVDARTDIWSLGVVIYEMVTGRPPFTGDSEVEVARAILGRSPRPMVSLRPGVPPPLERLVRHALAKRVEDRTASMDAMRAELLDLAPALAVPAFSSDDDRTLLDLPGAPTLLLETGVLASAGPPGSRVGPYEMLEILGGGGMGVVYKARDTRLARIVALKFLPPELTRDPQAKERFEQEARAASSLDHPNLCTILELGETPDGRLYLAMPCYDGETLRRRIERGALPVAEAADVALQIARGLSKAHRNGIVHRDIKPANVIVTTDGVVKILDFGLAKLAGAAAISQAGSSAGTPAYMSPEQARGDEVDPRTDLWSLGVVLYEMLAGRRPFRGEREQAVIYAILNERPQPLRELRPEAPPELVRIVERLIAKNPAGRYASVDEPLAELRAFAGEPGTTTFLTVSSGRKSRRWPWAAAAVAVAVLAVVAAYLRPRADGGAAAPVQASFTRLTDQEGSETFPSASPDGHEFAYVKLTSPGNLDIYSQRIGGSNFRNLTADSPADDTQPAFSPDGASIAFRSERDGGGIFLMGATGESVRRLTSFGYNPAWSPDGKEVVVATEGITSPAWRSSVSQLWRIEVADGSRRLVSPGDAVQPSWSPHGRRIAYWGIPDGKAQRDLWTVAAARGRSIGTPVRVTDDAYLNWSPAWSPDGRYLYYASDRGGSMNLWRVPIEEGSGKVLGAPEPITTPSASSGLPSLTRRGHRILYAVDDSNANIYRAGFDPEGAAVAGPLQPVTQGSRFIRYAEPSPDGRWIAYDTSAPQEDLFVMRADGTELRRLTNDTAKDRVPRWSPDGSRLLFFSNRGGKYEAWTVRPDGSGLRQATQVAGEPVFNPIWSPDGRRIVAALGFARSMLFNWRDAGVSSSPVPLAPGGLSGFGPNSWSPDGRRLAGTGEGSELLVYELDSHRLGHLTHRGRVPFWLADSRRLLYLDQGKLFVLDTVTRETREVLAPPPSSSFLLASLSADNRTLYAVRATDEGDIGMIDLE
jgi:serine/threonine protein kinase/Tol biopolymer transport system component